MVMLSDMSVVQQQLQQLNSLKRCSAFHKLSTSLSLSLARSSCAFIFEAFGVHILCMNDDFEEGRVQALCV